MKKRILIFSMAYYPNHIGGAEIAIKEVTDRLPSDEYEWHIICNRYDTTLPKTEKIGNTVVHRIGFALPNPTMTDLKKLPLHLNKLWYQELAYYKAVALHKKNHFHGIWAMMAHATGIPTARFKKRFTEVPYLLTLQEGDPPAQIEHTMRWFGERFTNAFTTPDQIQVISRFLGQWAVRQGFLGTPILIPNAVDVQHFAPRALTSAKRATIRHRHTIPDDAIVLITTSRLVRKNGIDTVIAAMSDLPSDVIFMILGTGPDELLLQDLAHRYNVTENIRFVGYVSHEELPAYLHAADIFIRTSRSEGMGNSFIEAMAAHKPVIATMVGGIPDFLHPVGLVPLDQATGWAVAVDTPADIVRAVAEIRLNPALVLTVTKTAANLVNHSYDWSLVAKRMEHEVFKPLFQKA